jgi:hypothetical protein
MVYLISLQESSGDIFAGVSKQMGAQGTLFKEAHFYIYNASATPQIP